MEINVQLEKFIRIQSLMMAGLFYKERIDSADEAMQIVNSAKALDLYQKYQAFADQVAVDHPCLAVTEDTDPNKEAQQVFCKNALKYLLTQVEQELNNTGV